MQKKHLMLIIILLTLAFGAYIYFNPPGKGPSTTAGQVDDNTKKNTDEICMNYDNLSPSELRGGLVKEMIQKYQANQLAFIRGNSRSPMADDAHSIWFDIDTLEKFIYDIKIGVKKNAPSPGSKLGIRIYYAAYPEKTKWRDPGYEVLSGFMGNPVTEGYENMHTLVMLPTIKTGNYYSDFNPSDASTYKGFRQLQEKNPLGSITSTLRVMAIMGVSTSSDNIEARNHGQLIPPGDPNGEAVN